MAISRVAPTAVVCFLVLLAGSDLRADTWTEYDDIGPDLLAYETAYPLICERHDLGLSVEGRHLWALRITDNIGLEEDEPEFKYIATMHGDEIVGTKLCMMLIDHLLTNYGVDPRITNMVDSIDIWIVPLMNPDGYDDPLGRHRTNGNGVDLNRNFPAGAGANPEANSTAGREPETAHIMNWMFGESFTLSANFHGGALVVNYPFDDDDIGAVDSPTPDDDVFEHISLLYTSTNLRMKASPSFPPNGITNGADWYVVPDGMQDWNYRYMGCNAVTLELDDMKEPSASRIGDFWDENRESMLAYMETCLIGVRGVVTDALTDAPLAATITVAGRDHEVYTDPEVGDYHRMLLPGLYDLTFSAAGYAPVTIEDVAVLAGDATRLDVELGAIATIDVLPEDGLTASGPVGGPFSQSVTYEVECTSSIAADVEVSADASWITLNGGAGPLSLSLLGAGESENVVVGIAASAASLPAGAYSGVVSFVNLTGGAGSATRTVTLLVGSNVHSSADTPQGIDDNDTITSVIVVSGDVCIEDVNVDLDITHTYIGDLTVDLASPSGDVVRLHNRSGGTADFIDATYDEEGGTAPDGPGGLSDFVNTQGSGAWTLTVTDHASGDTGR